LIPGEPWRPGGGQGLTGAHTELLRRQHWVAPLGGPQKPGWGPQGPGGGSGSPVRSSWSPGAPGWVDACGVRSMHGLGLMGACMWRAQHARAWVDGCMHACGVGSVGACMWRAQYARAWVDGCMHVAHCPWRAQYARAWVDGCMHVACTACTGLGRWVHACGVHSMHGLG